MYRLSGHRKCSVIRFPSHSVHRGTRRCSQVRSAKGLALAGFGTPVELDPFSETNCVTFLSKGWQKRISLGGGVFILATCGAPCEHIPGEKEQVSNRLLSITVNTLYNQMDSVYTTNVFDLCSLRFMELKGVMSRSNVSLLELCSQFLKKGNSAFIAAIASGYPSYPRSSYPSFTVFRFAFSLRRRDALRMLHRSQPCTEVRWPWVRLKLASSLLVRMAVWLLISIETTPIKGINSSVIHFTFNLFSVKDNLWFNK